MYSQCLLKVNYEAIFCEEVTSQDNKCWLSTTKFNVSVVLKSPSVTSVWTTSVGVIPGYLC